MKRGSGIGSYRDLGGKTLVVTSGTTNEAAMKQLNDKYKLGITIVSARDHDESYAMLADGKADAFATDDVLLYGFIVAKKAEATMAVVGDFITYEPYGIMFRRDDPLMAAAVTRAFLAMARQSSARRHLSQMVSAAGPERRIAQPAHERPAQRGVPGLGRGGIGRTPARDRIGARSIGRLAFRNFQPAGSGGCGRIANRESARVTKSICQIRSNTESSHVPGAAVWPKPSRARAGIFS